MARYTKKHLKVRIDRLNDLFGQSREAWTEQPDGTFKSNAGTFVLDCAYGGYRLSRICNDGGGERDLTPRGTARETYDCCAGFEAGAIAWRDSVEGK